MKPSLAPFWLPWLTRLCLVVSGLVECVWAQRSDSGIVEGRIFAAASGEVLENARVTVEGSRLETFTGPDGHYRLTNLQPGTVRLRIFYTGLIVKIEYVEVGPGATVRRDVGLLASPTAGEPNGEHRTVKLPRYVVTSAREMAGAALAINEQRFAPNIKTVVSTDEFGPVAEGNVAEFLKFLPGVTINYTAGNARGISINGVPSDNVPVTINGFNLASGSTDTATSRSVAVDMVSSLNTLSRIELAFSPAPESPGSALAGSVNMVTRTAFERARPEFDARVFVMLPDTAHDFTKTPGVRGKPSRNVHPGAEFMSVVPVNRRFGFTLSGAHSTRHDPLDSIVNTWRGGGAATNGATFAHTTADRPYLSSHAVSILPKNTTRKSFGATVDYGLTRNDRLSFSFQYTSFEVWFMGSSLTFNTGRVSPGSFTTTSTQGAVAAGNLQLTHEERNRFGRNIMPTLTWRHDGPVWKLEAGAAYSQHSDDARDLEKGSFRSVLAIRTGVTVSFDDIFYLRPRVITVKDGRTGEPVDPSALSNYALNSVWSLPITNQDIQRSVYANARRDFFGRVPVTLKAGADLRQSMRDARGADRLYAWLGRDGRSSSTPVGSDDLATPFLDSHFSQHEFPFGFPRVEVVNNRDILAYAQANPSHLTHNPEAFYRSAVTQSKHIEEVISSAYLRGDVSFLDRRLKLVGGVRAEQTNIHAQGPLTDPARNFRRDAQGALMLGANGRPLNIATNALEFAQLTYIDRGARVEKEYLRFFPSLNAASTFGKTSSRGHRIIIRSGVPTSTSTPAE